MSRRAWLMLGLAGALAALLFREQIAPPDAAAPDAVRSVLQERADNAGFARVLGPRPLAFPRDHGAHPEFRHEWWYLTGHLHSEAGPWRGFQLTFFRYAPSPETPASHSRWRSNQWVVAHFAVSDPATGRFLHKARLSRVALDLAGLGESDAKVWLGDWRLERNSEDDTWHLSAATDEVALQLRLTPSKPLVLQGDAGYSAKSAEPGNASHYYSLPRLAGAGELQVDGRSHPVAAQAWLDHEWGTSGLGQEQAGWDWFALQLDDGRELTFYRLRRHDGTTDPHSRGLLVGRDGDAQPLVAESVTMRPVREWTSPQSGIRYPVAWEVALPGPQLTFRLEPLFDAQEWAEGLRYWEGAVVVRTMRGGPAIGRGYLELTGYAAP